MSNFHISTPSPYFNVDKCDPLYLTTSVPREHISTLKRGRGRFGFRQKRVFFQLRKDADITRLFGSNVSTRLSMIVASWGISILNISAFLLLIGFDIMDISFDQWFPLIIEKFH